MNNLIKKIILITIIFVLCTSIILPYKKTYASTTDVISGIATTSFEILKVVIPIVKDIVVKIIEMLATTILSSDTDLNNASNDNLTTLQKNVVKYAKNTKPAIDDASLCQAWVANVYMKAGAISILQTTLTAREAGRIWGVSKDFSKIQAGATIYGDIGDMGHVGIYDGNGNVYHNSKGTLKCDSLSSWKTKYNAKCWGWNGGIDLTGGKNPISGKNLFD